MFTSFETISVWLNCAINSANGIPLFLEGGANVQPRVINIVLHYNTESLMLTSEITISQITPYPKTTSIVSSLE